MFTCIYASKECTTCSLQAHPEGDDHIFLLTFQKEVKCILTSIIALHPPSTPVLSCPLIHNQIPWLLRRLLMIILIPSLIVPCIMGDSCMHVRWCVIWLQCNHYIAPGTYITSNPLVCFFSSNILQEEGNVHKVSLPSVLLNWVRELICPWNINMASLASKHLITTRHTIDTSRLDEYVDCLAVPSVYFTLWLECQPSDQVFNMMKVLKETLETRKKSERNQGFGLQCLLWPPRNCCKQYYNKSNNTQERSLWVNYDSRIEKKH